MWLVSLSTTKNTNDVIAVNSKRDFSHKQFHLTHWGVAKLSIFFFFSSPSNLVVKLSQLLNILGVLTGAPMLGMIYASLKLSDLVDEFSRWDLTSEDPLSVA